MRTGGTVQLRAIPALTCLLLLVSHRSALPAQAPRPAQPPSFVVPDWAFPHPARPSTTTDDRDGFDVRP